MATKEPGPWSGASLLCASLAGSEHCYGPVIYVLLIPPFMNAKLLFLTVVILILHNDKLGRLRANLPTFSSWSPAYRKLYLRPMVRSAHNTAIQGPGP